MNRFKLFGKLFIIFILTIFLFSTNVFATPLFLYNSTNGTYNPLNAMLYLDDYTLTPNSAYAFYSEGGDCTNFASQVTHHAGMPMEGNLLWQGYSQWFYLGNLPTRVSYSWTAADYFRRYWACDELYLGYCNANSSYIYTLDEVLNSSTVRDEILNTCGTGAIIQLIKDDEPYHSMIAYMAEVMEDGSIDLMYGQHSSNQFGYLFETLNRLSTYSEDSRPEKIQTIVMYELY